MLRGRVNIFALCVVYFTTLEFTAAYGPVTQNNRSKYWGVIKFLTALHYSLISYEDNLVYIPEDNCAPNLSILTTNRWK